MLIKECLVSLNLNTLKKHAHRECLSYLSALLSLNNPPKNSKKDLLNKYIIHFINPGDYGVSLNLARNKKYRFNYFGLLDNTETYKPKLLLERSVTVINPTNNNYKQKSINTIQPNHTSKLGDNLLINSYLKKDSDYIYLLNPSSSKVPADLGPLIKHSGYETSYKCQKYNFVNKAISFENSVKKNINLIMPSEECQAVIFLPQTDELYLTQIIKIKPFTHTKYEKQPKWQSEHHLSEQTTSESSLKKNINPNILSNQIVVSPTQNELYHGPPISKTPISHPFFKALKTVLQKILIQNSAYEKIIELHLLHIVISALSSAKKNCDMFLINNYNNDDDDNDRGPGGDMVSTVENFRIFSDNTLSLWLSHHIAQNQHTEFIHVQMLTTIWRFNLLLFLILGQAENLPDRQHSDNIMLSHIEAEPERNIESSISIDIGSDFESQIESSNTIFSPINLGSPLLQNYVHPYFQDEYNDFLATEDNTTPTALISDNITESPIIDSFISEENITTELLDNAFTNNTDIALDIVQVAKTEEKEYIKDLDLIWTQLFNQKKSLQQTLNMLEQEQMQITQNKEEIVSDTKSCYVKLNKLKIIEKNQKELQDLKQLQLRQHHYKYLEDKLDNIYNSQKAEHLNNKAKLLTIKMNEIVTINQKLQEVRKEIDYLVQDIITNADNKRIIRQKELLGELDAQPEKIYHMRLMGEEAYLQDADRTGEKEIQQLFEQHLLQETFERAAELFNHLLELDDTYDGDFANEPQSLLDSVRFFIVRLDGAIQYGEQRALNLGRQASNLREEVNHIRENAELEESDPKELSEQWDELNRQLIGQREYNVSLSAMDELQARISQLEHQNDILLYEENLSRSESVAYNILATQEQISNLNELQNMHIMNFEQTTQVYERVMIEFEEYRQALHSVEEAEYTHQTALNNNTELPVEEQVVVVDEIAQYQQILLDQSSNTQSRDALYVQLNDEWLSHDQPLYSGQTFSYILPLLGALLQWESMNYKIGS